MSQPPPRPKTTTCGSQAKPPKSTRKEMIEMAKISKRELNYRVDFTKMTLTMTAEFADNAYNPATDEYEILTRLQRDFPRLRVVRKTHRSPKTANPAKGLTYERMEKYIRLHENADELLDLFQKVQSAGRGYPYVKAWFVKQFPHYNEVPEFKNGKLRVVEPVEAPNAEEAEELAESA